MSKVGQIHIILTTWLILIVYVLCVFVEFFGCFQFSGLICSEEVLEVQCYCLRKGIGIDCGGAWYRVYGISLVFLATHR